MSPEPGVCRARIRVGGAVQGVGFRPFVFRLTAELGLAGWVGNSAQGVVIEAEGPRPALDSLILRLGREKPPRAFIQSLEHSFLDPAGEKLAFVPADAVGPCMVSSEGACAARYKYGE